MSRLLPEWLNANYHRQYPFDETTAAKPGALPTTFLLDMQLFAAGPIDKEHTYISRVENDGASVSIYAASGTNPATDIGLLARVPLNQKPGTDVQISLKNANTGVLLHGYITVGLADIGKEMPGAVHTFTEDNAKLHPGIVTLVENWTAGLVVDDILYGGNVNLVAGTNVRFRAEKTTVNGEEIPVVYIDCTDTGTDGTINSDEDILEHIKDSYGQPVYQINGVYANENGAINITIQDVNGPTGTPSVSFNGNGIGTLVVKDSRTKPCCTLDDQQIVLDNLAAVNERAARIESLISEVETNLNSISAQLAIIGNNN